MAPLVAPLGAVWSLVAATGISSLMFISGWPVSGPSSLAAALLIFASTLAVDVLVRDVSSSHTVRSALDQYLALNVLEQLGSIFYRKMLKDTQNLTRVQEEILLEFLSANKLTENGLRFHFSEIKNREDFIHAHPLTTYSDVEPYITRMVAGEKNILTSEQPKIFAVTSGTSGKTSILPFLRKQQTIFFLRGITIMSYCMMNAIPETKMIRKGVKFFYSPRWRQSADGIPIGPNSSSPASTKSILHLYTTPPGGFEIKTEPETLYVHLLFALKNSDLGTIEANFASLVFNAFLFLEINWEFLVEDVEKGVLKEGLDVSVKVRRELNLLLKPDKLRATELRKAFEKGWNGIAARIWPKLSVVLCVDSGAFAVYAAVLREKYCSGIPIYSPLYAATEGLIGLNIWPKKHPSRYLLVPRAMFFEFIRLEDMEEIQTRTLFLDQVKQDEVYELVLTNASGLCRYRFGDVIRVVDFLNQCPVIEFLYRKGQLLNVRGEKLSENVVYTALENALRKVAPLARLVDYTTCESVFVESFVGSECSYKAPYYGVFLELAVDELWSLESITALKNEIDAQLNELSYVYKSFRLKESIGPPKVCLCNKKTFAVLREFLLMNNESSANQVKIPRVLKKTEQVQFLLNHSQNRLV